MKITQEVREYASAGWRRNRSSSASPAEIYKVVEGKRAEIE